MGPAKAPMLGHTLVKIITFRCITYFDPGVNDTARGCDRNVPGQRPPVTSSFEEMLIPLYES
jgi:hypothetical protein